MNLADKLELKFRLDEKQKKALKKLNLFSVSDLLFHFPVRYSDISEIKKISELIAGEITTVYGKVSNLKTKKAFRSKIPMAEGEIADLSGKIKIIWYNQAYLAKMLHDDQNVKLTGKVTAGKHGIYLANPEFEKLDSMPIDSHDSLFSKPPRPSGTPPSQGENYTGFSYPIYHETQGITSKWFYHAIEKILKEKTLDTVYDYVPSEILKKYNLPSLSTALVWIHRPKNAGDREAARKRFAFEEVFCIQLERQHDKFEYHKNKSFQINTKEGEIKEFLQNFPFKPTNSQTKSIDTILSDMKKDFPMSRLLEGDVGSGKTLVAATASYAVVNTRPPAEPPRFEHKTPLLQKKGRQNFGNLQVAYMAPTEILATQHFESFIKYFVAKDGELPINTGLITGSGCRKFPSKSNPNTWTDISRAQLLKWVANGEIPILIGTHALIQKSVKFKNLALVVIDEQHRFGTAQRRKLVRKDTNGNTVAPQIITEIITPDKRTETYEKIKKELEVGRQLYVICPRIDEPDPEKEMAVQAKSVTAEAKRLKKEVFREYEIGVLHSKMSKQKKEEVMQEFTNGEIHILCATSVVEVGVNVPNATIIIIEGAERFGLAQLHQLRGRVIRSNHQAYCYVFAEAKSQKTIDRLKALKTAKNGFELAELELKQFD
ncbi:MAG: protein RecG [Candidatus Nomurabacteria bacterium GW2011_GWA2_40_9]|uniref:Protein RecG n=1 Tax=Candidatus Nomurabacteria bacterium GW2011_GWA2_40_9 TaxID=1618734 RepID=A0A0G0TMN2_9BACT|nr:MAG: protein RecG [Candidatus Nomurabacteria bacterium GW2011_GWA2_40_9]